MSIFGINLTDTKSIVPHEADSKNYHYHTSCRFARV